MNIQIYNLTFSSVFPNPNPQDTETVSSDAEGPTEEHNPGVYMEQSKIKRPMDFLIYGIYLTS